MVWGSAVFSKTKGWRLEHWSLFYLSLPWFIFIAGWFKPFFAFVWLIALSLLVGGVYRYYHNSTSHFTWPPVKRWVVYLIILAIGFWVFSSGITGLYFHQNGDFQKHNAILYDLVNLPWPVAYHSQGNISSIVYLAYYCGFYLPAALVGKCFGLLVARLFLFAWAWAGGCLGFFWFVRLLGRFKWWVLPFFILASGMDIIGELFMQTVNLMDGIQHIEWWTQARFWTYQSHTTQIYWVPHQAFAGWILTSLFYDFAFRTQDKTQEKIKATPATLALLGCLWSPFVMLGLVPLIAYGFWHKRHLGLRGQNWWDFGGAVFCLIPIIFLFASNIIQHFGGFIWVVYDWFKIWPKYVIFCWLEFGLVAFFLYPQFKQYASRGAYQVWWVTVLTLLTVPLYFYGMFNDFGMRVSMPSLFLFWLFTARTFFFPASEVQALARRGVIFLLCIGAMTPLCEISRAFEHQTIQYGYDHLPFIDRESGAQYFGRGNAIFFRVLAKEPQVKVSLPAEMDDLLNRWSVETSIKANQ